MFQCDLCGYDVGLDFIKCSVCGKIMHESCYNKHLPCGGDGDDEPFYERDKHKEFYQEHEDDREER